jgi:hypothetical protein
MRKIAIVKLERSSEPISRAGGRCRVGNPEVGNGFWLPSKYAAVALGVAEARSLGRGREHSSLRCFLALSLEHLEQLFCERATMGHEAGVTSGEGDG